MFAPFLKSATWVLLLLSLGTNTFGQDAGGTGKSKEEEKRADNLPSGVSVQRPDRFFLNAGLACG